ncbi:MAG: hypothetical protein Hyperionvirus2_4 [Hyperionvirus sp.]|uniref:Uncharacterized protein n=1 Tax=Hyperionvirus sp. TaxID=2487770 RepID=A0A3G5A5W6_9VIRU|nr:MAG: hypothetical protein Hyperionvirus2_4 [Hyperionvirus sp.]
MCVEQFRRLWLCGIDKKSVLMIRVLGGMYFVVGFVLIVVGGGLIVPHVVREMDAINSELRVELVDSKIVGTVDFSQGVLGLVYAGISPVACNMIENTGAPLCYGYCPGPKVGNHYLWCDTYNVTWSNISTYNFLIGVNYRSQFVVMEEKSVYGVTDVRPLIAQFRSKEVYCPDIYSCSYDKYPKKIVGGIIGMSVYAGVILILLCFAVDLHYFAKHQLIINKIATEFPLL